MTDESLPSDSVIDKAKLITRLVRCLNRACDIQVSTSGLYEPHDLMSLASEEPTITSRATALLLKVGIGVLGLDREFKIDDFFKEVMDLRKQKEPGHQHWPIIFKKIEPTEAELQRLPA